MCIEYDQVFQGNKLIYNNCSSSLYNVIYTHSQRNRNVYDFFFAFKFKLKRKNIEAQQMITK